MTVVPDAFLECRVPGAYAAAAGAALSSEPWSALASTSA
eukprot:CAMPEP_0114260564 /NCGR_PEP_ID=MMETSP0058-20121206/20568_1 /TAXON_ID=36894 /ORGANISM="Pyramimonas parkeae, CCMP726" /LENGTH=38 /DNA_ID= /DNA_START= /DNA_END= /DNA_ORIENTATION=